MTSNKEEILHGAQDTWQDSSVAAKYARAENATRPFADIMVKKSGISKLEGKAKVLDLACGTGAVAAALYDALPKSKWDDVEVLGGDVSQSMLDHLKVRAEKEGWNGLETAIVDGNNIQLPTSTYTHLFTNFAIFALAPTTLSTCHSLLCPGGFIAISTWAFFPWYPLAVRAISALPNPPPIPSEEFIESAMYSNKPWNSPQFITQSLEEAGFVDVEVVKERFKVDTGTPAQFAEIMTMPLQMFAMMWEESKRKEILGQVVKELERVLTEETGGAEEHLWMEFEGLVGVGRKA